MGKGRASPHSKQSPGVHTPVVNRLQEKLISGKPRGVSNAGQQEGANQPSLAPAEGPSSLRAWSSTWPDSLPQDSFHLEKQDIKFKFQLPWDCRPALPSALPPRAAVTLIHREEAEGGELVWAQALGCGEKKGCLAADRYEQSTSWHEPAPQRHQ